MWDVTFAGYAGEPVRPGTPGPRAYRRRCRLWWSTRLRTRPGPAGERLTWPVAGYAHLLVDNRGQAGLYSRGDTPDPHDAPGGPAPPRGGSCRRTTTTTAA
ncbi:hypothetical protein V2I01_32000 [Micromonospora sp. BRA006-A]|nr:hypothetical protein [Micromonospora sp. BRA006-A]